MIALIVRFVIRIAYKISLLASICFWLLETFELFVHGFRWEAAGALAVEDWPVLKLLSGFYLVLDFIDALHQF